MRNRNKRPPKIRPRRELRLAFLDIVAGGPLLGLTIALSILSPDHNFRFFTVAPTLLFAAFWLYKAMQHFVLLDRILAFLDPNLPRDN